MGNRVLWTGMARASLLAMAVGLSGARPMVAQTPKPGQTPPATDSGGPVTDNGDVILKKKKEEDAPPPPAPAEEKVKNPNGDIYSLRVDVPIVNLDVSVILDKTHQFVPGLKPENFVVLEDGVEQDVTSIRTVKTPITAVMLLEFASNSYYFINDMRNASASFFRTLQPEDYIAVETYDLRPHILTDFTNNRETIAEALNSLMIPGFSDTNEFDALYETLDRLSRIDGRKYIILIGTGRDTFSKLTWDQMMDKIRKTPNVTIFTISTGALVRELADARGGMSGPRRLDYLQADNEMKTIAQMTGGLNFAPMFQGALPDVFGAINEQIRNQYVVTYKPSNNKNDGTYRKIKVILVDKEGRPLKMQDEKGKSVKYSVVARDGYKAKLPVE